MKTDFIWVILTAMAVPPEARALRPLADLAPGAAATVASVREDSPLGRRLLDLGFVPGTGVRVVRRAPLGDPVEFELRGYRLCLRRSEALQIQVAPA